MAQRKHPGTVCAATGFCRHLCELCVQRYLTWSPLQTLCECALASPYISLKLGMLAVLSTLSETIAIKQYFSSMTGCLQFQSELWQIRRIWLQCTVP